MHETDARPESTESPMDEAARLRAENAQLRRLLAQHGIPAPVPERNDQSPLPTAKPVAVVAAGDRAAQRIALYRSLFRGRDDVYAVRWASPDGRSGYSPRADRDWQAYLAAKESDRRKVDRQTRKFRPLTDDVVRAHLMGEYTIGIYPLLLDETCWFLAVDFDKKTWQRDAGAFLETCRDFRVPAALERSRSGDGGHVWIFFDRPIPASTARKLGCAILTRTMERRHQIGLDSYDRLFPSQDTLPAGGFGNLIALPLQRTPRRAGNSVFVDADFRPYADQWEFLSTLQRQTAEDAAELVSAAMRSGTLIGVRASGDQDGGERNPWTLPPSGKGREPPIQGPLPEEIKVVRSNLLYIEKTGLPSGMLNRLLRLAAFQNPEFYRAQAMRLSTFDKPRVIACGEELTQHVAIPRGCLAEVVSLLEAHNVKANVRDERFTGIPIEADFRGQLRPLQRNAVSAFTGFDEGILCAPTAFGKTVVAAQMIAERKVNTLVLVHRQQLLDQWRERLTMFLGLPAKSVGQIGGGKNDQTRAVDVALIQSLHRRGVVKDLVADYGQIIVDECHHISAFTFERVLRQAKAKYVVGLTATPTRKDGHHPIIFMQCGPIRFSHSARAMTKSLPFEHFVVPRQTGFAMEQDLADVSIHDIYAALVKDPARNQMIVDDLVRAVRSGHSPLLLTGRTAHLQNLVEKLRGVIENVFVLRGGMGRHQRRAAAEAMARLGPSDQQVILATGSYIGEGFDDARLDTLFLAMPISWKGTLQQYVGRLHRLCDSKRAVLVYDYVDFNVPMLARMYQRRLKGYSAIGYKIKEHPDRPEVLARI
ncbi:MAG: DEAD/DEAH box helicase family protein [Bryobacterales bacterium]|nr:DEAD/DEAH box helicase family protein [Bryobacterales bacterium]